MKKTFTLSTIVILLILLVNCSPKTGKQTTKTEEEPKRETANQSDVVTASQENRTNEEQVKFLLSMSEQRMDSGKQLYETSCVKCHKLHSPSERTAESWVQIMKKMGPKANLQQGPYSMISAYLVKNSKGG